MCSQGFIKCLSQFIILAVLYVLSSCNRNSETTEKSKTDSIHACMSVPARFTSGDSTTIQASGDTSTIGMVLIPAGNFEMGGDNNQAGEDEYPKHEVLLDAFYMDITEVTNS